jgi:hypothetical protein
MATSTKHKREGGFRVLIKETKKKEKYRKGRNIENQIPQPASDFSMN